MRWRIAIFVILPVFLLGVLLLIYFSPETAAFFYDTVAFLSPLWLPVLLAFIAWPLWLRFVRLYFVASVPYTTLELRPGPDTPQTARPMELVFYSLYHRTEITKRDFILGRVRLPWSFEAYAHQGSVRFFVHLPVDHLAAFESRVRAEYHDIEIYETRDYSREIPFHSFSMQAVMCEYGLTKPDPYPIKTYIEHEQEGEKDLFSQMLEELSAVGPGEHMLVSYLVRPHQRERVSYFKDPRDTLHEDAHHVIAGILGPKGDIRSLPPAQQATIIAIEGALKKPSFDCGIRALYLADKNRFDSPRATKLQNLFSRFNDGSLNSFAPYDPLERANFFAKEVFTVMPALRAHHFVDLYRRRAFFAPPYVGSHFILNTEELATVFHMPPSGHGGAVSSGRSAKLEPPENLPL